MTNKKLILEEKDGSVLAGISQKDCDPLFASFKGTLTDLLMEEHSPGVPVISGFVAIAETKWAANPKATKYTNPALTAEAQAKKANEKAAKKAKAEAKASPITPEAKETSGTPQLPLLDEKETPGSPAPTETAAPDKDIDAGEFAETPAELEPAEAAPVHVATSTDAPCPACQADEVNTAEAEKLPCNSPGFYLQDGSGPFVDIQLAMDALGMPKDKRPTHKRYGRLSKDLQAQIVDKTK